MAFRDDANLPSTVLGPPEQTLRWVFSGMSIFIFWRSQTNARIEKQSDQPRL